MAQPDLFSHLIIQLLQGVLYQERRPDLWNALLNAQAAVRDYIAVIGLELLIDEAEGYAFLRQADLVVNDEKTGSFPRLIQRRPLGYFMSLLCVLLRKKLIENDTTGSSTRVILTHQQMIEMMTVFLPERANEVKIIEQIETGINKMLDLGFLRRLKNNTPHYEVQRIIKALVDAAWLNNIDEKLQEYQEHERLSTS